MTLIDRIIDKWMATPDFLPVAEQESNLRQWLGEAYEEGRKNGEKYKGDAKRRAYLDGVDDMLGKHCPCCRTHPGEECEGIKP